jgi:hypothetical protein
MNNLGKDVKKVLFTLSCTGLMMSCMPLSRLTTRGQGTVVKTTTGYNYIDSDNDGLADNCIYINSCAPTNNQRYFADYLQVGDTLKYSTVPKKPVQMTADVILRNTRLDSVNNRSAADLKKIYKVNLMRKGIDQAKAR